MTELEQLVGALARDGIEVTPEQAEAMALRISGSVGAYLALLAENQRQASEYRPLEGAAPEKFAEPVSYEVESPEQSGLPGVQP